MLTLHAGLLVLGAVIAVLLPSLAGSYFVYRYYQRRQRPDPLDDQDLSEPLNGMTERKSPPLRSTDLPWWHWRRWTVDEEPQYFPLADRSPHGRERTE